MYWSVCAFSVNMDIYITVLFSSKKKERMKKIVIGEIFNVVIWITEHMYALLLFCTVKLQCCCLLFITPRRHSSNVHPLIYAWENTKKNPKLNLWNVVMRFEKLRPKLRFLVKWWCERGKITEIELWIVWRAACSHLPVSLSLSF